MKHISARIVLAFLCTAAALHAQQQPAKPYKGYAILGGNGSFCAVFSDDSRICEKTKQRGVQHFYVNDYTVDYIASTSFDILDRAGHAVPRTDSTGMRNYFTPVTYSTWAGGITGSSSCFVHPQALVLSSTVNGAGSDRTGRWRIALRRHFTGAGVTSLVKTQAAGHVAVAAFSNGVVIGIASGSAVGNIAVIDSVVEITAPAGSGTNDIMIAVGTGEREMRGRLLTACADVHPAQTAQRTWDAWLAKGTMPNVHDGSQRSPQLLESYKRNMYAVKSAALNGQVPADITGQFTTNNMPQLYPRDAMMCARVFLETGHTEEAKRIITYWTSADVPRKSPGEFYARYDARGRAVDAGSGARYDEPEWDANGYLIQLLDMYHTRTNTWLAPADTIVALADFLTRSIDSTGLLYEGGIVEWTGYLPATNMVAAAGLLTASRIAHGFHDTQHEARFRVAGETISRSLPKMYDRTKRSFMALRFHGDKADGNRSITTPTRDTLYLWDTTVNFGVLWGSPLTPEVESSNAYYDTHTIGLGGGMQYFDAQQDWLASYGHDVFFFTTSAAAQYQAKFGQPSKARAFIAWMTSHANIYGLMPERIYLNGSDCSDASPLSWCCAEYALSIVELSRRAK